MDQLRKKAEEIIKLTSEKSSLNVDDVKKLIHELQVYQIELELQNNELKVNAEKIRKAENKFITLFNLAPVAYLLLDFKGIALDCNFKAAEILKRNKQYIVNKPIVSLIAGGRKDDFYSYLTAISEEKVSVKRVFPVFLPDKNVVSVEFNSVEVHGEFILCVADDVTEREVNERLVINALEKANESDNLKSKFLNTISHEIRTPLNAIVGFSELLCRENLTSEKKTNYVEAIKEGSNKLISNIEDILLITRLQTEKSNLILDEINVKNFLFDIVDNYSNRVIKKNNIVVCQFFDEINFISDRKILRNIFDRLLDNANKFTCNGSIEIGGSVQSGIIEIHIKDTGCGISSENQKKLFKPFTQFSENNFTEGLGLGLLIASEFIKLLDGTLTCESEVNKGSIFTLKIPVKN